MSLEEFMSSASRDFIKEAVFFNSRAEFEEYMKSLENQYYQTVNLPRTPYEVQSSSGENLAPNNRSCFLPEWPPKPTIDVASD